MSLRYQEIRKLALAPGAHPRGLSFLSAASGLVRVRDRFYVVADDELHLGVFTPGSAAPVALVRLLDGDLPASADDRKARKPDFESLLLLPPTSASPGGSLLALGSGSRPNRCAGVVLDLDASGDVLGSPRPIDLEPLYADLASRFERLNIEGAFVIGTSMMLLQRGVAAGASAAIRFDLAEVLAWLGGKRLEALLARSVQHIDLGTARGVPFAFTDGAALPDGGWVFSAVAEDRHDSYDDGPCVAAAIGICGSDDARRSFELLVPTRKIEGIEASLDGATAVLSLVTDADDPECAAEFGTTRIALDGSSGQVRASDRRPGRG